ncbi:hypothetical protein Q9R46_07250 [Paenibacillus sp. RRE4]|uniref:hypothetical protein n=1 Tax=Paenibacillus sp. RRE4 TaxID=2962587 RepID=UPI0028825E65|nr:hypothetical protein [Paenibacillus sp. RRE4]MDT0122430.1 hypothetical protein [Paenibacillus sp. RRE4]
MSQTMTIPRIQIKFQSAEWTAVVLRQKDINIKVKEELGHLLLVDAKDCPEMFLLASLFQHAMYTHDIIYFAREDDSSCDLLVFNGAITPIHQKDLKNLKTAIKHTQPETYTIPLLESHDESIWKTWQPWKYDEQLRVMANKDLAIINASQLGYELLIHQCAYLASSYSGHSHFDHYSTKKSIELIIRNMKRNN